MPVVLATWEAEVGGSAESEDIKAVVGGYSGRIARVWEVEAAVSCDCPTVLQPGRQSETPSQKINK